MAVISEIIIVSVWNNYPQKVIHCLLRAGEKDVMSLAAHGFHAICFNSETVTVPPTLNL